MTNGIHFRETTRILVVAGNACVVPVIGPCTLQTNREQCGECYMQAGARPVR